MYSMNMAAGDDPAVISFLNNRNLSSSHSITS